MIKKPLLLIFSSVIILTFLYSQFVYAFGIMPFLPPKIEDITIHINKYGQVTSADIKRRVITDISKGGDKWKNVSDYTMEIKLTTDQDSMGRVTAEHETTHIFGKEGYQDKNGKWKSKDVDYTINRDRTYSYNGNSIL